MPESPQQPWRRGSFRYAWVTLAIVLMMSSVASLAQEPSSTPTATTAPPTPSPTATMTPTATVVPTTSPSPTATMAPTPTVTPTLAVPTEPIGEPDATVTPTAEVPRVQTEEPGGAVTASEVVACAEIGGDPVSAALIGGELPPLTFSFEEQIVRGELGIRVLNPNKCDGWTLAISASDLAYHGDAPGQDARALPASSLRVVLAEGVVVGLTNEPRPLINDGGGDGFYVYPMELVIPGGTAAGSYTATVTLSTSSGPGTGP